MEDGVQVTASGSVLLKTEGGKAVDGMGTVLQRPSLASSRFL